MKVKRGIGLLAAVALAISIKHLDGQVLIQTTLPRLHDLGPWAPAAFVAAYVLATIFFLPGSFLTLGAGALFGLIRGTLYASLGSLAGATAAFLIGRYLARDWVSRKINGNPKFKAVSAAVAREGWKIVGLTRLSPVFPFNLLNYAYGVTGVTFRDYLLASWIGMAPGTIVYVYLGSIAGDLAGLSSGGHARTPVEWGLYGAGLIAAVAVSLYVTRIARAALEEETRA